MSKADLWNGRSWEAPSGWLKISTVDLHTGGEPLRVITNGLPEIKGDNILAKRRFFRDNLDFIRTGIMFEPRGHADMYGAVITPPVSHDADFGTFFMHNEGYSTMCGHAIIALVKLVLETGLVRKKGNEPEIVIDAPPGKIVARAVVENDIVRSVSFLNVPSFVLIHKQKVRVQGIGHIDFDVAYGGAFYAICNADQFNLPLDAGHYNRIIDLGRQVKSEVLKNYPITHPFEEDLSFLYGTIFTSKPLSNHSHHSRNVCVFADGELDRSSTGSGVSARAALHFMNGELGLDEKITIESILGTTMDVRITETIQYGGFKAIIPEVTGMAHFTGSNTFVFDPEDPLREGFIFR